VIFRALGAKPEVSKVLYTPPHYRWKREKRKKMLRCFAESEGGDEKK